MKKYNQFRAEQQYITEVGPLMGALMGVLGLATAGYAGYKTAKAGIAKWKGWKESQAEKKANEDSGVEIEVKKINPATGEEYEVYVPLSGKDARLDSDGLEKKRKDLQKKYDTLEKAADKSKANENIRKALGKGPDDIITKDDKREGQKKIKKALEPETPPEEDEPTANTSSPETTSTQEPEVDRDEEGNIKNQKDAQAAFEKGDFKKAPSGWTKDPEDETGKTVIKPEDIKKSGVKGFAKKGMSTADRMKAGQAAKKKKVTVKKSRVTGKDTGGGLMGLAKKQGLSSQRILKFGEFISEGVMNDLLKAGKSKKDSEISLDDGADIPIDPLTSQILVKYIEGLSSSEKNRTIQQIQRTERAFMKVLGKAHENT